MARKQKYIEFPIALLIAGSAISLLSCGGLPSGAETNDEALISRVVRDMEVLSSENGVKRQLMRSPLVEEHAFANPAYSEHPRGIEAIGFDSIGQPSSKVVADHALHWTERDLWELKGNVLVEGEGGEKLYTQQLYWDKKTRKIWSNVDSKVEQDGDVIYGVGFEALDDFSRWTFRGVDGTVRVDVEPTEPASDSTAVSPAGEPVSESGSRPESASTSEPASVSTPAPTPAPSSTPTPAPSSTPTPAPATSSTPGTRDRRATELRSTAVKPLSTRSTAIKPAASSPSGAVASDSLMTIQE